MTRIPRNQATGLEVLATFIGLGVFIGLMPIEFSFIDARLVNQYNLMLLAGGDFCITFLLMSFLMPTWGAVGLEYFQLRQQAERYAAWAAVRHLLLEQRIECALRAAYLAKERGDQNAALLYAESGLAIAGTGLDRPVISFYYALCLDIRASYYWRMHRYQEALEDYASATRLHLKPPTLTAQYYAHAAGLLYFLGRFDESVPYARQAIAAAPHIESYPLSLAYRSAALSLAELGQYKEAEQLCEVGMRIKPYTAVNVLMIADHA